MFLTGLLRLFLLPEAVVFLGRLSRELELLEEGIDGAGGGAYEARAVLVASVNEGDQAAGLRGGVVSVTYSSK